MEYSSLYPCELAPPPFPIGPEAQMRLALFACLFALLLLAACSGDDVEQPVIERGLSIRDAGLDPEDPAPLTRPVAWAEARDADSVLIHLAFVARDSTPAMLALTPTSGEDASGFVRWEVELPPRTDNEALDYRFEAYSGMAIESEGPHRVEPGSFVIDFPWPDWPVPAYDWPEMGDASRVLDGAEDEATLKHPLPYRVINHPIWTTREHETISSNGARLREGIGVEVDGQAYFLPLAVLVWNKLANLNLGSQRSGVSYSPLTDATLHFDSGFTPDSYPKSEDWRPGGWFNNNMLLAIGSLRLDGVSAYSQMLGIGFIGPEAGRRLTPRPAIMVDMALWGQLHPETLILEGDQQLGDEFDYMGWENPFSEYWISSEIRFPLARTDDRMHPKQRVFGILFPDDPVVVPLQGREDFVHHTRVSGLDVVILNTTNVVVALHAKHPLTGEPLKLTRSRARWRRTPLFEDDSADPSLWTLEGVAISGPARGHRLGWIPSTRAFWYAWYAIYPEARFELPEAVHER